MYKARCSSLKSLMTGRPLKSGGLDFGDTVKSMIKRQVIFDVFGYRKSTGNQYTDKGKILEDDAIRAVGLLTGTMPIKNTERRNNQWVQGECDVLTPTALRDIKCSWSMDTHPWFIEDAEAKVKECGYDWQGQGYMWLWDREVHYVDFVLLPTPSTLLKPWDDEIEHIDMVQAIPLQHRITTVKIERDESMQEAIKARMAQAIPYYVDRYNELAEKHRFMKIGEGE